MITLGARLTQWLLELSKSFRAWYHTTPLGHLADVIADALNHRPDNTTQQLINVISSAPTPVSNLVAGILATITGNSMPQTVIDRERIAEQLNKDPQTFLENVAKSFAENPQLQGVQEAIGGLLDATMIAPLEDMLDKGIEDTHEFIRLVHGVHASVIMAAGVFGLISEITGLGQIKTVTMILIELLESMGLSRIGFRTVAPLFEIGVNQSQQRAYARRYRPRRWSETQIMELFALRQITEAELRDEMQTLGWRDKDINMAVRLSEQRIQAGDIFAAYDLHVISQLEAVQRLHDRGFAPDDIDFLMQLEDAKQRQQDLDSVSAIAGEAFKKDLISEARYRTMRAAAHVPQDRIDLEVEIAALTKKAQLTSLHVANIEQAFKANVLSRNEADKYLQDLDVDATARQIMLDTWEEQKAPKIMRLNSNTISQAYVDGVIDRSKAAQMLKDLNWTGADAELLLTLADRRTILKQRSPSESQIITAYNNGILAYDDAKQRLNALGFNDIDADLILKSATIRPRTSAKTLTEAQVTKLLEIGVFDWSDALNYLGSLGYDEQTANLVLIANTSSKPKKTVTNTGA